MPAYYIAEHIITNPTKFEEYRVKVGPMIAKHGGRYLTKGGSHKLPEGGHWKPERVVIIEFPDMGNLNAWYNSAGISAALLRYAGSTATGIVVIILEGDVERRAKIQPDSREVRLGRACAAGRSRSQRSLLVLLQDAQGRNRGLRIQLDNLPLATVPLTPASGAHVPGGCRSIRGGPSFKGIV